eukprot:COSAG02_NODE_9214_length_2284_cov_38.637403_1_plen_489_part_10
MHRLTDSWMFVVALPGSLAADHALRSVVSCSFRPAPVRAHTRYTASLLATCLALSSAGPSSVARVPVVLDDESSPMTTATSSRRSAAAARVEANAGGRLLGTTLERRLSNFQRQVSAKQSSLEFSASSTGLGDGVVPNWPSVDHHERPAVMQMRPASVCWSTSTAMRGHAARLRAHRRPTTGVGFQRKSLRHKSLSPLRPRGGARTPEQRGHSRARSSGNVYTVKSLGQLSEGSSTGWKPGSCYARLNSDITDPSKSTASPSYSRSSTRQDCPTRASARKAAGQLNSKPPLQSRPLRHGSACQVFVRSKNAFVPAVVLELTSDDDGNDMARVQHCVMLGGVMEVYTNRPTEFRPSASPQVLTYQLSQCWQRWQEAQSNAEASLQRRLLTSDQSTTPIQLSHVHSKVARSARDHSGSVSNETRELAKHADQKTHNPTNSSRDAVMPRGSDVQSSPSAAAAASTQSAVGIGQNTIGGIKQYIIRKVEQNSI